MTLIVWVVQGVLALLSLSGGAYKVLNFDAIANQMEPLSRGGTGALGVFEVSCAFLLVAPTALEWRPALTPLAAAALALESLCLAGLYARAPPA